MFLYWIHLPEHTDCFTQGYIGVSKHPKQRLKQHKYTDNPHLSSAFEKYGKLITQTVLLEGNEHYCFEIENKLRPKKKIGWNIAEGGFKPPSRKGVAQSLEHRRKIGLTKVGKPRSSEMVQFLSETRKGESNPNYGNKHTPEARHKMLLAWEKRKAK